ncbi:hypothetical protein Tco_0787361 [Tanacetum coccineum]
MSDSKDSTVTYIDVSSPFGGLSDIGSPGVVGPEHEGLPWMLDDPYVQVSLQALPSPDYIPGLEEPQSPPLPDFVPEPVYPEFMPPEDEILLAEEQPLPAVDSPTADSPGYIPESDPEEDPEEDDDEDPEEDPADYPVDGGDDGDDEDEPSDDDEDDEVDIEADDEEEEEHPAFADSIAVALPTIDQALSAEETKPFETNESVATPPPHPAYRVAARISITTLVPTPVWSVPEIPSLPLPVSSPVPKLCLSPLASPIRIALGPTYEVEESSSAAARPARGLRVDYGFIATMDREIRRDLERDVGYGITDSWDEIAEAMQDTYEVYTRLDDEQTERQLLAGRLNMLFRDRHAHAQVISLCTTVLAQQSTIRELQSADRRRQTVIIELLAADYRRQRHLTKALKLLKGLQTQMAELQR